MADKEATRSYDLDVLDSESSFLRALLDLRFLKQEHCVQAQVLEYDRKTHMVTVVPLPNRKKTTLDGQEAFSRAPVKVRCLQFCHGGFTIDAPLFVGDTGWLLAGDRNGTVGVMGKNSAVLREDQKKEDLKGSLKDLSEGEKKRILSDDYEPEKNEGPQNCDNSQINCFENGFFLPCSWAKCDFEAEDGLVVKYDPPEEKKESNFKVKISKDGVSIAYSRDEEADKPTEKTVEVTIDGEKVEVKRGADDSPTVVRMDDDGVSVDMNNGLSAVTVSKESVKVSRNVGTEDEESVTLSDEGLKHTGKVDRRLQVLTDLRYDLSSHQLQKKTVEHEIRGDFVVGVGEESDWTMMEGGQAVPEQTGD